MAQGSTGDRDQAQATTVLVVSPPSDFAAMARAALLDAGFAVALARDGTEARGRIRRPPAPSAAFLNLFLPGEDSLALLSDLRAVAPALPVIAVAAPGALTRAAAAVEGGAFDHLALPADAGWTTAVLRNALAAAASPPPRLALTSASPAARAALLRLGRLAPAMGPVLLQGERGAGRQSAARAMHAASVRAAGPFVRLDCTEHDDAALLDLLFGPGGGALHGGALAAAAGGTLMLDGISAAGPALQSRLVRLLQSPAPDPSAHAAPPPRLIFATARDLRARAREGRFREELHYRLAVGAVILPPLRDRPEDVLPLARTVLAAEAARLGRPLQGFHPEVLRALAAHPWPGNLHQLNQVVRTAAAAATGPLVTPDLLPADFFAGLGRDGGRRHGAAEAPDEGPPLDAAGSEDVAPALALRVLPLVGARLDEVEAALIEATLAHCRGSTVQAARLLGVAPSTLYRRRGRPGDTGTPAD